MQISAGSEIPIRQLPCICICAWHLHLARQWTLAGTASTVYSFACLHSVTCLFFNLIFQFDTGEVGPAPASVQAQFRVITSQIFSSHHTVDHERCSHVELILPIRNKVLETCHIQATSRLLSLGLSTSVDDIRDFCRKESAKQCEEKHASP